MISIRDGGQPLYDRLWGSGFLPSQYQGVKFRSAGDPVLYLSNPTGFTTDDRRAVPRFAGRDEPDDGGGVRRSRNRNAASRSTRWRSACKRRCRN